MSFLVKLDRNKYPPHALDDFTASVHFNLVDARAMMWLSQLAYETDDQPKVESILDGWHLTKLAIESNAPSTGLPPHSACAVVAEGDHATFVIFGGSDPLKFQDWITDFDAMPDPDGVHTGFEAAVETVWPAIQTAIEIRAAPEQPLFLTGHSLGGALAIIAAGRAAALKPKVDIVVYTFGSPRTGGMAFFNDYTRQLGDTTFRLVDGTDIVPTVPPTLLGTYRHVGCAVQCRTEGLFDPQTIMSHDGNKPDIIESAAQTGIADIGALAALRPFQGIGPGLSDQLAGFLPRMILDHVPDNYFRALSITIDR
jgi:triacylglycerol lipase